MALRIKKASEKIACTAIKVLVYGEPGIGKTTLSLTAPNTLLIDCDAGIRRVEPQFRKDYMEVGSWNDINDLVNSPDDIKNYDTLAIDTVGKLLDFLSVKIIADNFKMGSKTGGLTLQGYGALLGEFRAFNSRIIAMGKNIIYLSHDREFTDGEKTKFRPDIIGRSLGTVLREMDLVGYMQSRNNERTISFSPSDTYYGKNTCNLPPVIGIPDMNKVKAMPMSDIFDKFKLMMDSQSELMEKYQDLFITLQQVIETVSDEATANQVSEDLKTREEIWDSKTIARLMFTEKIAEVGVKFNKDTKTFEKIEPETK